MQQGLIKAQAAFLNDRRERRQVYHLVPQSLLAARGIDCNDTICTLL